MLLEQINRARANPVAEVGILQAIGDLSIQQAYAYFKVDFATFATDMAKFPALPPLAPSSHLVQAARGHSQWMLANALQAHEENGLGFVDRVNATGYVLTIVGESIYAYADNPVYSHVGFEVDWGLYDGMGQPIAPGMQNPPGHRLNNHNPLFHEVGVGLVKGSNSSVAGGTVGPELYTIDFATRSGSFPYVTGVAYFDLNSNGSYDVGEGLPGVRVDVAGSGYFAKSASSGGFAVPTSDGQHAVTFSAPGLASVAKTAVVSGGQNSKVDLRLDYVAPTLQGPATPAVGQSNPYQPTPVPAATAFKWVASRRFPVTSPLGAENGQEGVSIETSAGYPCIQTLRASSGSHSYRLTTPDGLDQTLRLTNRYAGGTAPVLHFAVEFGYATTFQTLSAEISTDGGAMWTPVWSASGHDANTDAAFASKSVSLSAFAGREFQLRFRFHVPAGSSYYPSTDSIAGVFVDAIAFDDAYTLADVATGVIAASAAVPFIPPSTGEFALSVQPQASDRLLPAGPKLVVNAVVGIQLARPVIGPSGKVRIDFAVAGGTTPGGFFLERVTALGEAWQTDATAALTTVSPGSYSYRTDPPAAGAVFYRVSAR